MRSPQLSTTLDGRLIRLEPYADVLKDELRSALDTDEDGWRSVHRAAFGEHFEAWWDAAMAAQASGRTVHFAIRRKNDGRVIGTTSFRNVRPTDLGVEIGATFIRPEARGGGVNLEAKRLMLSHALGGALFGRPAFRVEISVGLGNTRSLTATDKLGAVREGVLRRGLVIWTGEILDLVMFSVTQADWPAVRESLDARLAAFP